MKQKKIVNKITFGCGNTVDIMKNAQKEKDDEFYTPLQPIVNELSHWGNKLTGKHIICPCDWDVLTDQDVFSIRAEFSKKREKNKFSRTYYINKVEHISYSLWDDNEDRLSSPTIIDGDDADELIKDRVTCNFFKFLCELGEEYGALSVTASGYDIETNRGIKFQDIDYSAYDICITNPPFSIYAEFMKTMVEESENRKNSDHPFNFILLSPFNNRVTPNVGLPLMLKQCYLGYTRHNRLTFINPTSENNYHRKIVTCDWITTFPDAQQEVDKHFMHNGISYEAYKDDYEVMENMTMKDGTHPLKINNYRSIPDDYFGWMFSSIGVLDELSNDEFEWYITSAQGYFNKENPQANPFAHRATNTMLTLNDKRKYHGIILRRKQLPKTQEQDE